MRQGLAGLGQSPCAHLPSLPIPLPIHTAPFLYTPFLACSGADHRVCPGGAAAGLLGLAGGSGHPAHPHPHPGLHLHICTVCAAVVIGAHPREGGGLAPPPSPPWDDVRPAATAIATSLPLYCFLSLPPTLNCCIVDGRVACRRASWFATLAGCAAPLQRRRMSGCG